ncbi:hypothetical protein SANTM175S_09918 [Streptomyces antimycoticus]
MVEGSGGPGHWGRRAPGASGHGVVRIRSVETLARLAAGVTGPGGGPRITGPTPYPRSAVSAWALSSHTSPSAIRSASAGEPPVSSKWST